MQCIYLHLTVHVVLYAARCSWVAEQKAACFVPLVVAVGIRRGKMGFSESSSSGQTSGMKGEARHVAESWQ